MQEENFATAAMQRIHLELLESQRKVIEEDDDEDSDEEEQQYGAKAKVSNDSKDVNTCPNPSISSIQKLSSPEYYSDPVSNGPLTLQTDSQTQSDKVSGNSTPNHDQLHMQEPGDKELDKVEEKNIDDEDLVIETQVENGKKMTQLKIFQFMK